MPSLLVAAVLLLLVLNARITFQALRDPWMDRAQKVSQLAIIWLLPLAGAALVWHLRRHAYGTPSPTSEGHPAPFEPEEDIPHDPPPED